MIILTFTLPAVIKLKEESPINLIKCSIYTGLPYRNVSNSYSIAILLTLSQSLEPAAYTVPF